MEQFPSMRVKGEENLNSVEYMTDMLTKKTKEYSQMLQEV